MRQSEPCRVKVSVIVPAYRSGHVLASCLRSLEHQTAFSGVEVIVVESGGGSPSLDVIRQFPWARWYFLPERAFPGEARNFGASQSRGAILAFTDADCVADPGWIREILSAHEIDGAVIGGAIGSADLNSYVGWAYYFCEFSQWMPGSPRGPRVEIPTCCLSLKRWVFDKYGPFLKGTYCSDTAFHWKLGNDGIHPVLVPSVKVAHLYVGSWVAFLKHEIFHGRCFARIRTREHQLSRAQQILFVIRSSYLPFLQFSVTALRVWRDGSHVKQFALSSPLVFLGLTAWSWGEFLGYLSKSARRANGYPS